MLKKQLVESYSYLVGTFLRRPPRFTPQNINSWSVVAAAIYLFNGLYSRRRTGKTFDKLWNVAINSDFDDTRTVPSLGYAFLQPLYYINDTPRFVSYNVLTPNNLIYLSEMAVEKNLLNLNDLDRHVFREAHQTSMGMRLEEDMQQLRISNKTRKTQIVTELGDMSARSSLVGQSVHGEMEKLDPSLKSAINKCMQEALECHLAAQNVDILGYLDACFSQLGHDIISKFPEKKGGGSYLSIPKILAIENYIKCMRTCKLFLFIEKYYELPLAQWESAKAFLFRTEWVINDRDKKHLASGRQGYAQMRGILLWIHLVSELNHLGASSLRDACRDYMFYMVDKHFTWLPFCDSSRIFDTKAALASKAHRRVINGNDCPAGFHTLHRGPAPSLSLNPVFSRRIQELVNSFEESGDVFDDPILEFNNSRIDIGDPDRLIGRHDRTADAIENDSEDEPEASETEIVGAMTEDDEISLCSDDPILSNNYFHRKKWSGY